MFSNGIAKIKGLRRVGILILILVSFGLAVNKSGTYPGPSVFRPLQPASIGSSEPWFRSSFVSTGITRMVHAASVVELYDGKLRAFWFAGSREGGGDVEIHSAAFDPERHGWSAEDVVKTRQSMQSDLYRSIRRLGNPVAARDPDGRLWLFIVSTSIGGWSTSSVNVTISVDGGESWGPVRRLITSPFLNLSTLVKTAPFFYRDGTLGLPIYHEFFAKYGEILRLDARGKVIEKLRLNDRWRTLQPLVLLESPYRAVALMRYSDRERPRMAIRVVTEDAGRHWSEPIRSMLPNPDSAIAGIAMEGGRMIAVINNNPVQRDDLTLMVSEDSGQIWKEAFRFEDRRPLRDHKLTFGEYTADIRRLFAESEPELKISDTRVAAVGHVMCDPETCRYQFDYPYLIRSGDGHFHLLYTWNRTYIKHIEFNQAWLEARIQDAGA
ncbi:MAG: exo-alpha-sialidase [Methylococcaceae bacterium]|nr:exo-alpha-sialidase [Methylococcaceae bacterium]MCI0733728.1 exo-alpha-sialidase [Methylococcaceae bacterium]